MFEAVSHLIMKTKVSIGTGECGATWSKYNVACRHRILLICVPTNGWNRSSVQLCFKPVNTHTFSGVSRLSLDRGFLVEAAPFNMVIFLILVQISCLCSTICT